MSASFTPNSKLDMTNLAGPELDVASALAALRLKAPLFNAPPF